MDILVETFFGILYVTLYIVHLSFTFTYFLILSFCVVSQYFALSPTEVGSLVSLGSSDSCEFLHDPSMKSRLEPQFLFQKDKLNEYLEGILYISNDAYAYLVS